MTRNETAQILQVIRATWPHSNLGQPADTLTVWHNLLGRFTTEDVQAAINELAGTGREHAPPPGVVLKAVVERVTDIPGFDEAWAEIDRLIRSRGRTRPPTADHFTHPLVAAFAVPVWRELCDGPAPGTSGYGTHYAQQREAYRAMAARAERTVALEAVGAPRRRGVPRPVGDVLAVVGRRQITDGMEKAA